MKLQAPYFFAGCGLCLALSAVLLAGCNFQRESVLGVAPPRQEAVTIQAALQLPPGQKTQVSGEMIEKCPVSGCWFVLKDKTGTVRVDTKSSGFVVMDVPLHTKMTVSGAMLKGETPSLAATGVRTE